MDLVDGTPVRLNRSVPTPVVVYARGSVGRYYGPPNTRGFVNVMIGACYVHVHVGDLLTLDMPFFEGRPEPEKGETPESGGYRVVCDY